RFASQLRVDGRAEPRVNPDIAAFDPTQLLQATPESTLPDQPIVFTDTADDANAPYALCFLCMRGEWPSSSSPTKQRNELAPPHSITSSARCWSSSGTSRPSTFAVLRFITSSYLVGACTGRSPGFSPLRMRSTSSAARRQLSSRSNPYDNRPPSSAN